MITINTMKGTLVDRVFKGGEFNFKKKTMLPKDRSCTVKVMAQQRTNNLCQRATHATGVKIT